MRLNGLDGLDPENIKAEVDGLTVEEARALAPLLGEPVRVVADETVIGPELLSTPNADAGDFTVTCSGCGDERDEPHSWAECHVVVKKQRDAYSEDHFDAMGEMASLGIHSPSPAEGILEIDRRLEAADCFIAKFNAPPDWLGTDDRDIGRLSYDVGVTAKELREAIRGLRARGNRSEPRLIPMVLHCPRCGAQHVDAPEPESGWTNPPHRSHKCHTHGCGCVWRPADVPTTGVASITTRGSADTWPLRPGESAAALEEFRKEAPNALENVEDVRR